MPNDIENSSASPLIQANGSGWVSINEAHPKIGDEIACCSEHRDGGMMSWAGTVIRAYVGHVVMQTRGDEDREFVITFDTYWLKLPSLPNVEDNHE